MTNGDVIGMAIGSRLIEGEDDVWSKLSDEPDRPADQFGLRDARKLAVTIVEAPDVLDAEGMAGQFELAGAFLPERASRSHRGIPDLPSLASCEGYDHRFRTAGDILRQRPPNAEGFIVRMSENAQQP